MDYMADGKGVDEPNVLPSGTILCDPIRKPGSDEASSAKTRRRWAARLARGACQVPGICNAAIELRGSRTVVKFRCATRLIVFNEAHLLRILSKYARYYNEYAPCTRPIARFRDIIGQPNFGGLHHRYARM